MSPVLLATSAPTAQAILGTGSDRVRLLLRGHREETSNAAPLMEDQDAVRCLPSVCASKREMQRQRERCSVRVLCKASIPCLQTGRGTQIHSGHSTRLCTETLHGPSSRSGTPCANPFSQAGMHVAWEQTLSGSSHSAKSFLVASCTSSPCRHSSRWHRLRPLPGLFQVFSRNHGLQN